MTSAACASTFRAVPSGSSAAASSAAWTAASIVCAGRPLMLQRSVHAQRGLRHPASDEVLDDAPRREGDWPGAAELGVQGGDEGLTLLGVGHGLDFRLGFHFAVTRWEFPDPGHGRWRPHDITLADRAPRRVTPPTAIANNSSVYNLLHYVLKVMS